MKTLYNYAHVVSIGCVVRYAHNAWNTFYCAEIIEETVQIYFEIKYGNYMCCSKIIKIFNRSLTTMII